MEPKVKPRSIQLQSHILNPTCLLSINREKQIAPITDLIFKRGFPGNLVVKESTCNVGDTGDKGSMLGLGRFPRGGNGNSLQYYCLKNLIDRGPWGLQSTGSQRVRHN